MYQYTNNFLLMAQPLIIYSIYYSLVSTFYSKIKIRIKKKEIHYGNIFKYVPYFSISLKLTIYLSTICLTNFPVKLIFYILQYDSINNIFVLVIFKNVKIFDATTNGNDVPGPFDIIIYGFISISNLKL